MKAPADADVVPEPELPEDVASAWTTVVLDIFEKQKRDGADSDATIPPVSDGGDRE